MTSPRARRRSFAGMKELGGAFSWSFGGFGHPSSFHHGWSCDRAWRSFQSLSEQVGSLDGALDCFWKREGSFVGSFACRSTGRSRRALPWMVLRWSLAELSIAFGGGGELGWSFPQLFEEVGSIFACRSMGLVSRRMLPPLLVCFVGRLDGASSCSEPAE